MSNVRDFIDHIDQDNNLDAQTVFDNELQTRIQQSLNNKREEVAGTFVSDDIEESTILEAKFIEIVCFKYLATPSTALVIVESVSNIYEIG